MNKILSLMLVVCLWLPLQAQEVAHALLDKDCYLTGERLHIRVDITDAHQQPLTLSKVAYVELSDAYRICAQGMVQLTNGRGWADIALPATMHSGNYLLSVYTRAMRNQPQTSFFQKVVSVVNTLRVVRTDNILYLPADSFPAASATVPSVTCLPGTSHTIRVAQDWQGCTVSLTRQDLKTPAYSTLPELKPQTSEARQQTFIPEAEGHIVAGRPKSSATIDLTRLVMVGRLAAVFDGQWQSDGTWHYYTSGLCGSLPTILSTYDTDGKAVEMEFVSPYDKVLPQSLPKLEVYCSEADLQRRSLSAQREQTITNWLAVDSLTFASDYHSAEPHYFYDLDEYTKFSTVREILVEFIKGVRRSKIKGVNQLFTIDPTTKQFSRWPAVVLLDGMPVYDIDEILEYDARLLKYVQIYTDRYTFGGTLCQGIISFISQRGRLSNYKLDAASRLVSYHFPQDRPEFIYPADNTAGTLYWNPCVTDTAITLTLPTEAGNYDLVMQRFAADGSIEKKVETLVIE